MKLDLALRELHRSENNLTADLWKMSDRHKVDHEIYYVARDLARWSQQHVHELAEIGQRYGLKLKDDSEEDSGLLAQAAKDSELLTLTKRCHPPSLRQMRWANAMLKDLSPQVLAS